MALEIIAYQDDRWRARGKVLPEGVRREIEREFTPPSGRLLLAYDAATREGVLGCAGLRRLSARVCEAKRFVVQPAHQRAGVGRRLMEALIEAARRDGYSSMTASVPVAVPALCSFLLRMAFTPVPGGGFADRHARFHLPLCR